MRYETIKQLKEEDYKPLTGVQHETFERMLAVVQKGWRNFGRRPKLSRADQLPMTLMYWREYRTEFHIKLSPLLLPLETSMIFNSSKIIYAPFQNT